MKNIMYLLVLTVGLSAAELIPPERISSDEISFERTDGSIVKINILVANAKKEIEKRFGSINWGQTGVSVLFSGKGGEPILTIYAGGKLGASYYTVSFDRRGEIEKVRKGTAIDEIIYPEVKKAKPSK